MVYSVTKKGSDWQQAYIRNTESNENLHDELNWLKFADFDWTVDEKGFFYNRYPIPKDNSGDKNDQFDHSAAQKTDELVD